MVQALAYARLRQANPINPSAPMKIGRWGSSAVRFEIHAPLNPSATSVEKVAVAFEPKEAVVTFGDARTSVDKLRDATAKAGYPSVLKDSK